MTVAKIGYFRQVLCDYASHSLTVNIIPKEAGIRSNIANLPALKGGGSAVRQCFAARIGNYLFQIASLNPALKGGACRGANRPKIRLEMFRLCLK
jgi:hypothetical protein